MAVPLGVFAYSNAAGPNLTSSPTCKSPSFSSLLARGSRSPSSANSSSPKTQRSRESSAISLLSKFSSSPASSKKTGHWLPTRALTLRRLRPYLGSREQKDKVTSVLLTQTPSSRNSSPEGQISPVVCKSSPKSPRKARVAVPRSPLVESDSFDVLRSVASTVTLPIIERSPFFGIAHWKQSKRWSARTRTPNNFSPKQRHVEVEIPIWAQSSFGQSDLPPRLSLGQSIFLNLFDVLSTEVAIRDSDQISVLDKTSALVVCGEMDSFSSDASQIYGNTGGSGSHPTLSSANSSQSSLVGRRDEYESMSESESIQEYPAGGHTANPSSTLATQTQTASSQATSSAAPNLSGLVCNVHRTTGQEPPPLVGATTTVVGDVLYVFGGRRLSRTKPQLTSNLYELDLVRRHWTRLEVKGDIPAPRYFHSICVLGDSKLVCYGGMSPAPHPESPSDAQSEVIVMSDIHIYDIRSRTWQHINTPDPPQGRYAHCAAILPSSAIFTSAQAPVSAMQHNPSGSNPNQGTLGISLNGNGGAEMVVVGGQDSANHYIEQVSVFNLRSLRWTGTTGMGRSCGAYRSVVCPLTTMTASQIGSGPHGRADDEDEDEDTQDGGENGAGGIGSGAPMLIYSNYNFLDVKLELQVRLTDGTLTEKPMQTEVSPPGLRFPSGGVIANHFVVSGTFLTSSKQEYALWALDLTTLTWSRIDAGGSIFSSGSWNRGVLWSRRNCFVILGNRRRSLVDDYNNRRINFSNICLVELEAFGLYENPRRTAPMSGYMSSSAPAIHLHGDAAAAGRRLMDPAENLGSMVLGVRELADMDILAVGGTRIPINSRLIARRWGPYFIALLKDSAIAANEDTATLRPAFATHRNSSVTITPSVSANAAAAASQAASEVPDVRAQPPRTRPRLFYLPHTAPTLQALLHFFYTSTLPAPSSPLATPQILCSILQIARPYKIDGLLEAVVERLHESLDGRNAAAIFNAAAMGAGGGDGIHVAPTTTQPNRISTIPLRVASLHGLDAISANGVNRANGTALVNGTSSRIPQIHEHANEIERPGSAHTEESSSESESPVQKAPEREVWNGVLSAVVGLQKRGLRGLMEGRRMRERGRSESAQPARVGLGIA